MIFKICVGGCAEMSETFLAEFVKMRSKWGSEEGVSQDLPVPLVDAQRTKVLLFPVIGPKASNSAHPSLEKDLLEAQHQWKSLESLLVQVRFGGSPFPALPRPQSMVIAEEDTDNAKPLQGYVQENVVYQLTLRNPLTIPLSLSHLALDCELTAPESASVGDGPGVSCLEVPHVTLEAKETKTISLSVACDRWGTLHVRALRFRLEESEDGETSDGYSMKMDAQGTVVESSSSRSCPGRVPLMIRGPRLNNSKKERCSVSYGRDSRLQLLILPQIPRVSVHFQLPQPPFSALHCGELYRSTLTIQNQGTEALGCLWLAFELAAMDAAILIHHGCAQVEPATQTQECVVFSVPLEGELAANQTVRVTVTLMSLRNSPPAKPSVFRGLVLITPMATRQDAISSVCNKLGLPVRRLATGAPISPFRVTPFVSETRVDRSLQVSALLKECFVESNSPQTCQLYLKCKHCPSLLARDSPKNMIEDVRERRIQVLGLRLWGFKAAEADVKQLRQNLGPALCLEPAEDLIWSMRIERCQEEPKEVQEIWLAQDNADVLGSKELFEFFLEQEKGHDVLLNLAILWRKVCGEATTVGQHHVSLSALDVPTMVPRESQDVALKPGPPLVFKRRQLSARRQRSSQQQQELDADMDRFVQGDGRILQSLLQHTATVQLPSGGLGAVLPVKLLLRNTLRTRSVVFEVDCLAPPSTGSALLYVHQTRFMRELKAGHTTTLSIHAFVRSPGLYALNGISLSCRLDGTTEFKIQDLPPLSMVQVTAPQFQDVDLT
ncbi:unnamed protein product, partial [Cyprideis torosa]